MLATSPLFLILYTVLHMVQVHDYFVYLFQDIRKEGGDIGL